MKAIPGRKTDELDSQWLARVFSADLIKPSYISKKKIRELISLTRLRVTLLEAQIAFKNRVHKTLQICNIRLSSKISSLFGRDGQMLLDSIMSGKSVDQAIEKHGSKRLKEKKEELKASVLGQSQVRDEPWQKIFWSFIQSVHRRRRRWKGYESLLVSRSLIFR